MKVALCIPAYSDTVKREFTNSLVGLLIHIGRHPFRGELLDVERFIEPGLLPASRNNAAQRAIDWGAEWMLWIDTDQTFPADTLHRLLAHDKPLVGANIRSRHYDRGVAAHLVNGAIEYFNSDNDRPPLELVYLNGMGVMLMRTEVIAAVAKFNEGPPFSFERNIDGVDQGEDYVFIHKAGRLGYECYVDNRLSMEVGHLSEVELKF